MDQGGANATPFPVGYRFAPTDGEVVMFLSDKAALGSLPAGIIKDIDASEFFSHHPRDIGISLGLYRGPIKGFFLIHDDTFFHETLETERAVGEIGFWSYGEKEEICDDDGNIIAYKIHSTYFKAIPRTRETEWNMEVYWLPNTNRTSDFDEELPREQCVVAKLKNGRYLDD